MLAKNEFSLIENHIKELKYNNLKNYFNKNSINKISNFMIKDKKNYGKSINLVLLRKIAKPVLNNTYSQMKVKKFLSSLID